MKKRLSLFGLLLNSWWLRHIMFWVFILNYFIWGFGIGDGSIMEAYTRNAKFIPGYLLVVYPLLYFLIPQFLFKKKYSLFFTGFISLFFVATLFTEQFRLNFDGHISFAGFDIRWGKNILTFIHVAAIATTIKFIKYAYFQEGRTMIAMQHKILAELELRRARMHPYFLFNDLNSLHSSTREDSTKSPEIILTLSDLLKFKTYESQAVYILLTQEIRSIRNFLEFKKFRFSDFMDISLNFSAELEGKFFRPPSHNAFAGKMF